MTRFTELLTPAERIEAGRIAAEIAATSGYALALRFIDRAGLRPRRAWKTCSIAQVRDLMEDCTGHRVTIEEMALALAASRFVAREIGGEPSTNVMLRTLPKAGKRIELLP